MPHIRRYKFSPQNLKDVLSEKFTVKLIYCSHEVLFYSSRSFPTSSLPRYNIFIAPRSRFFHIAQQSLISPHVHAAHGLIIILSHIFVCVPLVCASVYHRSLSFCTISSHIDMLSVSMAVAKKKRS